MSSIAPAPLRLALFLGTRGLSADARSLLALIESDERFELVALLETNRTRGTLAGIIRTFVRTGLATMLLSWIATAEDVLLGMRGTADTRERPTGLEAVQRISVARYDSAGGASDPIWQDIQALDLDVLVDLDGAGLAPHFAESAHFGCWSLTYLGGPVGFWEVYLRSGVTTAALQVTSRLYGKSGTIATASFTTRMTYTRTSRVVRDGAVTLVWRELRRLHTARCLPPLQDDPQKPPDNAPTTIQVLRYGSMIAGLACKGLTERTASRVDETSERWRLFVGTGPYEEASWSEAEETRPPSGEYWADPFLFRRAEDANPLVFFEIFEQSVRKGKLAVGRIENRKVVYMGDAIVAPYHLSYPFVFAHDDAIWMIPETHHARRIELWKCISYPLDWRLEKTAFHGQSVADSSICQHNGSWWLFANHASNAGDHNSELHVYKIDSPMMNAITPHRLNPVVIDATRARNGGRMHVRNGFLMRPAQDNSYRYGYGLGVYRIRKLTLDEYEEEPAFRVDPAFRPGISACHHLDSIGDMFIFDACRDLGLKGRGERNLLGRRRRPVRPVPNTIEAASTKAGLSWRLPAK